MRSTAAFVLASAAGALVAGCGGTHGTGTDRQVSTLAATARTVTQAEAPSLAILSPRSGQHTGPTVTVSVRARGLSAGAARLVYLLDGRIRRHGSTHLTFHELAPGTHRLEVMLVADASVRAERIFHVRPPAAEPSATPSAAPAGAASSPAPSAPASSGSPQTSEAPVHETHTSTQKSPQPEVPPAPKPPSESGSIPQGGGGDGDADNSGAPSDGDGNL